MIGKIGMNKSDKVIKREGLSIYRQDRRGLHGLGWKDEAVFLINRRPVNENRRRKQE